MRHKNAERKRLAVRKPGNSSRCESSAVACCGVLDYLLIGGLKTKGD